MGVPESVCFLGSGVVVPMERAIPTVFRTSAQAACTVLRHAALRQTVA
jgi:hypothetical protein